MGTRMKLSEITHKFLSVFTSEDLKLSSASTLSLSLTESSDHDKLNSSIAAGCTSSSYPVIFTSSIVFYL